MPKVIKILYRGHKLKDYLAVNNEPGVCFSIDQETARAYGQGRDNDGNSRYANGLLTSAEFNGELGLFNINGINFKKLFQRDSAEFLRYDAIECRGGIVYVLNTSKLKKISTETA